MQARKEKQPSAAKRETRKHRGPLWALFSHYGKSARAAGVNSSFRGEEKQFFRLLESCGNDVEKTKHRISQYLTDCRNTGQEPSPSHLADLLEQHSKPHRNGAARAGAPKNGAVAASSRDAFLRGPTKGADA